MIKIKLPNGEERYLDENIELEEKKIVAKTLVDEFEDVIVTNWNSNSIKFFLDTISNYLVWHKEPEEKGLEDKDVMSRKKMEKMVRVKKTSKSVNFSDLTKQNRESLFGDGGE